MKVALVTASSTGLGAAIAETLAPDMRVVINYSGNAERAAAVLSELEKIAGVDRTEPTQARDIQPRFGIIKADLRHQEDAKRLVMETIEMMGRLDVVVSNGGWTRARNFNDLDQNVEDEDWVMCYDMNVRSHLTLLHTARQYLRSSYGAFVTIASTAGVKPSGSSIPYSASKAMQIHMVKCLAHAVGPEIRINSVSPGHLLTDWTKDFPKETLEAVRDATALKRYATVKDVAQAVKMLVYNNSITGHNLVVDAGFTAS
ncbi:hypothetical protein O988_08650 [Pseudogymnoascus sp. VKM F-3808]|nr:hypothetical protein O988_08650 [Pseudogymnoascus sp. VKM F-3808]